MTYTIPDFGPSDLLTSSREGTRRLRVDVAQAGFFEGRVAPGVYYFVIENIDGATATGVFSAFWEERP